MDGRTKLKRFTWTLQQNDSEKKKISDSDLISHFEKLSYVSYVIFQLEKGDQTGNIHYQGYAELTKQERVSALNRDFFGSHIGRADGTSEDNIKYCTKVEKNGIQTYLAGPWTFGRPKVVISSKQKKTTLDQKWLFVTENIQNGSSFEEIFAAHPSFAMKHEKKIRQLISERAQPSSQKKIILWFYGEGGAGKTTFVKKFLLKNFPPEKVVIFKASTKNSKKIWFSEEHRVKTAMLFEEARLGYPNHYELINLFDGDSYLETKGGMIPNNFEIICITSIHSPQDTFESLELATDKQQILRRIDRIYEVIKNEQQLRILKAKEDLTPAEFNELYQPFVVERTENLSNYLKKLSNTIENQEERIIKLSEIQDKLLAKIDLKSNLELEAIHDVKSQFVDLKNSVLDWINNPKNPTARDILLKRKAILDEKGLNDDSVPIGKRNFWKHFPTFNLDWFWKDHPKKIEKEE